MKDILRKGFVEALFPEKSGGGLTGETHLVTYCDKKYVLRKCKDAQKARGYELLSKKFDSFGFLPKFLGRIGSDVFYEYIEGRDLRHKWERLGNIKQVGKILSQINSFDFDREFNNPARVYLKELGTGEYRSIGKVDEARKKRGIKTKKKRIFYKKEGAELSNLIDKLKGELKPKVVYDCSDPTPGNFRVRNGKVYLVDIDSINSRYKGFGLSKFFLQWGNTEARREKFIEGYGKKHFEFFNSRYKDFMDLNFLIQRTWFEVQTGKKYEVPLEKLRDLIGKLK